MFPLESPFRLSKADGSTSKRRAIQYGNSPLLSAHSDGREPTGAEVGKVPLTANVAVAVPAGLVLMKGVGDSLAGIALKSCVPTEGVSVAIACGVPDEARAVRVPKFATSLIVISGVTGVSNKLVALIVLVAGGGVE